MKKIRNWATHVRKLVTFDVDSQFTNVSHEDVLDFLERKLSSLPKIPIPVSCFVEFIRVCVTNILFFNLELYKQINGIAI